MLKMKDLLEEGRKIQETFKKNVVREATTKSKFTPLLSVRDNGDSATLVTPFGSITIETPGEYDTFNSYSDPSLSYTNPKRGISQSEWRRIASDIFDYATSERNYRKALEKLLDPKVLAKYIPKIKTVVETVNNNVVTEEITRKYRDEVNKEYIALASKVRKIGQFTFEPSKTGPSQWGATTKSGDGDLVVFFKPFSHPETGETQPKFEVSVWNVYPNSQGIESKFGGSSFANSKYMKPLTPTNDPKKDAKLAFDYIKTFLNSPDLARTLKSLR